MAEPPKGPKPGAGKNVSDIKSRIADQIKAGPPPPMKGELTWGELCDLYPLC